MLHWYKVVSFRFMHTNLPYFESSWPDTSAPTNPPMQKMDTVKDQMRDTCHCSNETPYLCWQVLFTSSFMNWKHHMYT